MLSKQFDLQSAPFPACLTAEALVNGLAEICGENMRHACVVFSAGKAEFYYDEEDAAGVAKSVLRQARKNRGFARRLQKDFNAHAKTQAEFLESLRLNTGSDLLAESFEKLSSLYSATEAYRLLSWLSLPPLEQAVRECLETHLPKKGRDEKISVMLAGKPNKKDEASVEAHREVEIPAVCQPYAEALPVLRKIEGSSRKANEECLSSFNIVMEGDAKILKLKDKEIRFLLSAEIIAALKAGGALREVARERMKYCIFSQKEGFSTFYVGGNAVVFGRQVLGLHADRTAIKP